MENRFQNVIFEVDSKEFQYMVSIVLDIQRLLGMVPDSKVMFVKRNVNAAVDWVANCSKKGTRRSDWIRHPP